MSTREAAGGQRAGVGMGRWERVAMGHIGCGPPWHPRGEGRTSPPAAAAAPHSSTHLTPLFDPPSLPFTFTRRTPSPTHQTLCPRRFDASVTLPSPLRFNCHPPPSIPLLLSDSLCFPLSCHPSTALFLSHPLASHSLHPPFHPTVALHCLPVVLPLPTLCHSVPPP